MKRSLISFISLIAIVSSISAFADTTTVVTETQSWQPVPITIDSTKHTYTVSGTVPTSNFYYDYQGYRCLPEKRDTLGTNYVVYNAATSGGSDIYCYPAQ